jgi:hypothetical protein
MLNEFFWDSPHTVRYGLAVHGHEIEAIRADRARCAPADPQRKLRDTVVTAFGTDLSTVCTLFESPGSTRINRKRSQIRSRGEHPFHVVKRLWGHTKVRYRGLAKNTVQLFALFTLSNLYMLRSRLAAA